MEAVSTLARHIRDEMGKVVVGQEDLKTECLLTLLCQGHALLEGVPGLAKTLAIKTLSRLLGLEFQRVQCTSDLMPADIIGTNVMHLADGTFHLHQGPVFTHLLLVDEVNRMPPRTQAALLECMEERQVTVDGVRHDLASFFSVFATQNPIEFEGTYPLPEAQLDRFLFNTVLDYLSAKDEVKVVGQTTANRVVQIQTVTSAEEILEFQRLVRMVPIAESVEEYVVNLVRGTRPTDDSAPDFVKKYVNFGASVRAAQFIVLGSKVRALARRRYHVAYEDIAALAAPVLRHRILLNFHAESEHIDTDEIIRRLLAHMPPPAARD